MTVSISFLMDEKEVRSDSELSDTQLADDAVLLNTVLLIPIRWQVGNVDLLQNQGGADSSVALPGGTVLDRSPRPWLSLPLLHVNFIARDVVFDAYDRGNADYVLPGVGDRLHFASRGSNLEARSVTGTSASAPFTEFLEAFADLDERVRELVQDRVPRLLQHPWFATPT